MDHAPTPLEKAGQGHLDHNRLLPVLQILRLEDGRHSTMPDFVGEPETFIEDLADFG